MKKLFKNQKGVSLMELMVSVGIFSVIMILATSIFQAINKGQQSAVASQNKQESLRYAFEVMSKEIRNARTSNNATNFECKLAGADPLYRVFNKGTNSAGTFGFDTQYLYFKNKNDQCVYYFQSADKTALMVYRRNVDLTGYVATATPSSIIVDAFNFSIYDRDKDPLVASPKQAYVTFSIRAHAKGQDILKNETVLETTISSRMYE